jgi:hypothetical protein
MTDPGFDFESERDEIETVYEAATGDELDWGPEDEFDPVTFGVYEAVLPVMSWPIQWLRYPVSFVESEHPKRLIQAHGFPDYWRKHGFPPQCRPIGDDDFECDRPRARASEKKPVRAPL